MRVDKTTGKDCRERNRAGKRRGACGGGGASMKDDGCGLQR